MKPQGKFSVGPQLGKGECKRCGAPRSYGSKTGLCKDCLDNPPGPYDPTPGPEFKRPLRPGSQGKGECKRCGITMTHSSKNGLCRDCTSNPPGAYDPTPGPEFRGSVESKARYVVNRLLGS